MEKTLNSILVKYLNFANMFLKNLIIKLLKCSSIKKYAIKLKIDKYLFYKLIYNSKSLKLETFKTYIKTNLENDFILLYKFYIKIFIRFVKKYNKSFAYISITRV